MPAQKTRAKCCPTICVRRSLTKLVLSCSKQGYLYAGQWLGTLERACRYVQPIGSRHGSERDVCYDDPMSGDRFVAIAPKDVLFIACGNGRKLLVRHRIRSIFRKGNTSPEAELAELAGVAELERLLTGEDNEDIWALWLRR